MRSSVKEGRIFARLMALLVVLPMGIFFTMAGFDFYHMQRDIADVLGAFFFVFLGSFMIWAAVTMIEENNDYTPS